jgi:hypothetical protein
MQRFQDVLRLFTDDLENLIQIYVLFMVTRAPLSGDSPREALTI